MNDHFARGGIRRYLDTVKPSDFIPEIGDVPLRHISLTGLADLFGTDKGSIKHHYTSVYERIINSLSPTSDIKLLKLDILEIGVACGSSLRMWASYLPQSSIYGCDIRSECLTLCRDVPNVKIFIADATSPEFLSCPDVPSSFDFIIDDGSHITEHIVATFNSAWSRLRSGGYYIVEDLACTYNPQYTENFRNNFSQPHIRNERNTLLHLVDSLMRDCDSHVHIDFFEYYPQLLVIKKL